MKGKNYLFSNCTVCRMQTGYMSVYLTPGVYSDNGRLFCNTMFPPNPKSLSVLLVNLSNYYRVFYTGTVVIC